MMQFRSVHRVSDCSSLSLSKAELRLLADGLFLDETADAIERCIAFVRAETKGVWHGRARAMMARRLKHCTLSPDQRSELVSCIIGRLESGEFSEQFKDQLRLALHLDRQSALLACRRALASPKDHVRRYAAWAVAAEVPRQE